MSTNKYTCPCCGYKVFDEPPGSFDICPVCGWEDDNVQLKDPTFSGGANKLSLHDSQKKFGLPRHNVKFDKDSRWEPFNLKDDYASKERKSPYYWEE